MASVTHQAELYRRLVGADEIRILVVFPGYEEDPVKCQLHYARLSDDPLFTAISYVWGDPNDTVDIECDRHPVKVTRNLYSCIKNLRIHGRDEVIYIWADAICINQADLAERASQVQLMGSIYTKALKVLSWLGDSSCESERAMDLVDKLGSVNWSADEVFNKITHDRLELPPGSAGIWQDLSDLLGRDYFRRAWIVQEVALAATCVVKCGDRLVPFESFIRAAWYMARSSNFFVSQSQIPLMLITMVYTRQRTENAHPRTLLSILQLHRDLEVTDPRDHIYAFYGLQISTFRELNFLPDYTLPAHSIYTSFAVSTLVTMKSLLLFSLPPEADRQLAGSAFLPSWVPDWSRRTLVGSLARIESMADTDFKASKGSHYSATFDLSQGLCGLSGLAVDDVQVTSQIRTREDFELPTLDRDGGSWRQMVDGFEKLLLMRKAKFEELQKVLPARHSDAATHGATLSEVCCRTTCAGFTQQDLSEVMLLYKEHRRANSVPKWALFLDPYVPIYKIIAWMIVIWCHAKYFIGWNMNFNPQNSTFVLVYDKTTGRSFFRTKAGYLGLGPPLMAVNDKIFLCRGGDLPLVLRRTGEHWQLIGDCYIYGMMQGELWDESKCVSLWLS